MTDYGDRALNEVLITCPKVKIAAVNGPAIGYGTTSLALYDLVYAVPDAYFFTPFMKWGFCAEGCSSVTFVKIMGHQKAAALLLAGERMSADELYQAGLITKIIPSANFLPEVLKIAGHITGYPPIAVEFTKRLMDQTSTAELLATKARECIGLRERFASKESLDTIDSYRRQQTEKLAAKQAKL